MKFRIEHVSAKDRPVYVFARQLEPGEFHVSPTAHLGEVPIKPHVSQPRALTSEGKPDSSLFAFYLGSVNDLSKLPVGQVVELSNEA